MQCGAAAGTGMSVGARDAPSVVNGKGCHPPLRSPSKLLRFQLIKQNKSVVI